MRRLLVLALLLLPTLAEARPDGDPDWADNPEGDHTFMLDRHMDPHWRREQQGDLADKAARAGKRAAAERRRKRKARAARTRATTPHPAP